MKPESSVRRAAAIALATTVAACAPAARPVPVTTYEFYDGGRTIAVVRPDGSRAAVARTCGRTTRFYLDAMRGDAYKAPSGAWLALVTLTFGRPAPRFAPGDARWLLSASGELVPAGQFQRRLGVPTPYAQSDMEWVSGYPRRLRYSLDRKSHLRGRSVAYDLPTHASPEPRSTCASYDARSATDGPLRIPPESDPDTRRGV